MDLVLVWDRNWLDFVCGAKVTCVRCEDRLTWFSCGWSKLTWVLCGYWNWPFFVCMVEVNLMTAWEIEINLISVEVSELTLFCVGVGNDSVYRLDRNCFCVGASKSIRFKSGNRIWLDVSVEVENNLFFTWGIEFDLILVWASKLTWSLCGGSKLDFVLCAGRQWLSFSTGIDWLGFVRAVKKYSVFVCGPWSSGDIRGISPGFLCGYVSWGIMDVAPCCLNITHSGSSRVLLGNSSHLLNLCRRGWPTHSGDTAMLAWSWACHPRLPITLRGSTSSNFRGSVEGWMVFSVRCLVLVARVFRLSWELYESHIRISSGWLYYIFKSVLLRVIGFGTSSIFGSGGDRGSGGGAVNFTYI